MYIMRLILVAINEESYVSAIPSSQVIPWNCV